MHPHNRFHGHAEILASHAGFVDVVVPPPIPGHLQHTWHVCGTCPESRALPEGMPHFVWSDSARAAHRREGLTGAVAIGAPWLYLLDRPVEAGPVVPEYTPPPTKQSKKERKQAQADIAAPVPDVPARPDGAVWFPRHGLRGADLAAELAIGIRAEEDGPVTVVLSDPDHHVDRIRDRYLAAGFDVTTTGPRLRRIGETGPGPLERLRDVMLRHVRVRSNAAHLGLLLGAAADLTPRILGPAPELPCGPSGPARADAWLTHLADPHAAREHARAELGLEAKLSPSDLRALFDWTLP